VAPPIEARAATRADLLVDAPAPRPVDADTMETRDRSVELAPVAIAK